MHGEAGLADKRQGYERGLGFQLHKLEGGGQGLFWCEITGQPSWVDTGRIGIGGASDTQDADNGKFFLTVIKKRKVTDGHLSKIVPRLRVAHSAQSERAHTHDVRPRCAEWREFYQPKLSLCFVCHFYYNL